MRSTIYLQFLAPALALAQLGDNSTMTVTAGAVTVDGTCGRQNGGTVCGDFVDGNCCSMYGYCGKTTAYCGFGCQSGDCTNKPQVAPTGFTYTMDGSCGATVLCGDWENGDCCSAAGWCGKTADYCGVGCIHGKCLGTNAPDGASATSAAPLSTGVADAAPAGPLSTGVQDQAPAPSVIPPFANTTAPADEAAAASAAAAVTETTISTVVEATTTAPVESASALPPFANTTAPDAAAPVVEPPTTATAPAPTLIVEPVNDATNATAAANTAAAAVVPTRENTPAPAGKIWAIDGFCNATALCGPWESGSCCSSYGWCGKSELHCGPGCQSGDCLTAPASASAQDAASTFATTVVAASQDAAATTQEASIMTAAPTAETTTEAAAETTTITME
ncbi:hypothetical protein MCOR22_001730 [Pyricularia oryzae]|nr:hypothetical protein MCOR22_001730 [Pyricularia oryzae]